MKFSTALRAIGTAAAATLLLAAARNWPAAASPEEALAITRVEVVLSAIKLRACDTNCEFSTCTAPSHKNIAHPQGNDGGEIHTCATSPGGCEDHVCNVSAAPEIQQLEKLIPQLNGRALHALAGQYAALTINTERGAVQVLGCGQKVLLSLNLTDQQAAQLAAVE